MSTRMEYQAVLLNDDGSETYESTAVLAVNNSDAIEKAKVWTVSLPDIADGSWLQINLKGIGIRILRPGEF